MASIPLWLLTLLGSLFITVLAFIMILTVYGRFVKIYMLSLIHIELSDEYDELEQAHNTTYGEFKTVRDDLHRRWKVKSCVDTAARFNERTEEQKLQNRPQTRHKKEELSR